MASHDRVHVAAQALVDLTAELGRDVDDGVDWDIEVRDEHVRRLESLVAEVSRAMP